ncbi:MAG: leucyl/phenylalanyl-tRNA--protein transferase [Planctomycetes bacterium]|nr:leucyl/phenylalanyl-tRNA--protein transferase [Planctomycetota bacterium]
MPPKFFPPPSESTPDGLLAVGGDLGPEHLLDAYRHGIFPWPVDEGEPMLWWSPDPRAILPLDGLHISRRLQRRLRSDKFQVTCDQAFADVLAGCATGPGREGGTWLMDEMIAAYTVMHRLGHAHSVEVWHEGQLAGGIYGIAIGGLFSAESMFYRVRDASKVALAHLVAHLDARGYHLLDVQQWTPHTGRLGAIELPRAEYLKRLAAAVELPVEFGEKGDWLWDQSSNIKRI